MTAPAAFVPRATFEVSANITRSYFLGHHAGALTAMRKILANISLVIECRDSRAPLTSTNPLLESSLAGRDRLIVYTKSDLSFPPQATRHKQKQQDLLSKWQAERSGLQAAAAASSSAAAAGSTTVVFTDERQPKTIQKLLDMVKVRAGAVDSFTGMRALVVGMPNAGKSTLLNAMRRVGMHLGKAAKTGGDPGVTRKMSTPVRVLPEDISAGVDAGVYVLDTPGVFVPYVGDPEAMLKLSLIGCVKNSVVPTETIADYLLYQLNLQNPAWYQKYCKPTNDVFEFLNGVGTRTGKLEKGGIPSQEQAAAWVVQQFRQGNLGRFCLDDVSEASLEAWSRKGAGEEEHVSMSQAVKRNKEARKLKNAAKRNKGLE